MKNLRPSELILNSDGNIYHLNAAAGEMAETIILVGDPDRVPLISKRFHKTEIRRENREIHFHTGIFNGRRLSVVSTGMGTDNIDIVLNELDALFNIDLKTRTRKEKRTSLRLIRIGTSGALQPDVKPGTGIASSYGLGLDSLLYFYKGGGQFRDKIISEVFADFLPGLPEPYIVRAPGRFLSAFEQAFMTGITVTAPGFYAPQGRFLSMEPLYGELIKVLSDIEMDWYKVLNMEMETSALYGLATLLNHEAIVVCTVLANRITGEYIQDPRRVIDEVIDQVLALV